MKPLLLPLSLSLLLSLSTILHAVERPNIVFILADDLGIGDTNIYGGERSLIETPNIDKLAKGGLRFTDAHVSTSVCGPTRKAIGDLHAWRYVSRSWILYELHR